MTIKEIIETEMNIRNHPILSHIEEADEEGLAQE